MDLLAAKLALLTVALGSSTVAQIAGGGEPIATYVGLGGQIGAVAGLVYVVRAMLTGDLVAQKTDELLRLQAEQIVAVRQLAENYQHLLEAVSRNEERLIALMSEPRRGPQR